LESARSNASAIGPSGENGRPRRPVEPHLGDEERSEINHSNEERNAEEEKSKSRFDRDRTTPPGAAR
jgi:hypothetical protein